MASIRLRIVTPEEMVYEGDADRIVVRTVEGEVCILPRHIDYLAAVGEGETRVVVNGKVLKARCKGGMLHVSGGKVDLLTTEFEWQNAPAADK